MCGVLSVFKRVKNIYFAYRLSNWESRGFNRIFLTVNVVVKVP